MKITIFDKALDDIHIEVLEHDDTKVFEALMDGSLRVSIDDHSELIRIRLKDFLAVLSEDGTTADIEVDHRGISFEPDDFREAHECWSIIKKMAMLNGDVPHDCLSVDLTGRCFECGRKRP